MAKNCKLRKTVSATAILVSPIYSAVFCPKYHFCKTYNVKISQISYVSCKNRQFFQVPKSNPEMYPSDHKVLADLTLVLRAAPKCLPKFTVRCWICSYKLLNLMNSLILRCMFQAGLCSHTLNLAFSLRLL